LNPVLLLSAVVATLAVGTIGLGVAFGRRVVGDYGHGSVRIISASATSITFRADRKTRQTGTFGLWFAGGHALVGAVTSTADDGNSVERVLVSSEGPLETAKRGIWEGDVFRSPDVVGPYRDVVINSPAGPSPAWQFDGADAITWAIHVHGIRTTRINAIRTVPALLAEGMTSLVIAYRGDGDGPPLRGGSMSLGLNEWQDLEGAIEFAVSQGAEKILLVGWSMGASMVLLATERSQHRDLIAGLILVSPPTDWRATMKNGAKQLGIPFPGACAKLAEAVLSHPLLCKLTGLMSPIDFEHLDWLTPGRLQTPCLVIHSPGDRTVPIKLSRQFAEVNPELVELYESAPTDHAWEYNIEPDAFNRAISGWLGRPTLPQ